MTAATAFDDAVMQPLADCRTPLLIGVRHHSAALARVMPMLLDEFKPKAVLLEMPPDFAPWLEHLGKSDLEAPVALAACDEARLISFYPLADFSPELAARLSNVRRSSMRKWLWTPIVLVLAAGCSSNPLPAVKDIDQIRLTVNSMPGENPAAAKPRTVTIKAPPDIVAVTDWLNTIDWSQTGRDMAVIDMPPPDGNFMLIDKSAGTHSYSFYWDGNFVNTKANRLMRGGDNDQLKKLVERLLKAG